MKASATAHGAITIINATATGHGCSLAIDAPTTATWEWGGSHLQWQGSTDDKLARAVFVRMRDALGRSDGATVDCQSTFPPSRGLKTSSAAAIAMARAGLAASGSHMSDEALEDLCIDAAMQAGVTLTGAYDDQVAVARGGCHITDNRTRRIEASLDVPGYAVAVWVPGHAIPKTALKGIDPTSAAPAVEAATQRARAGDIPGALSQNGHAYHALYHAAGLPVSDAPVQVAMDHGALGAGLSGTGPAVSALFLAKRELPPVPGGVWIWSQTLGVTP